MKYARMPAIVEAIQFTDNESFGKMLNAWGDCFEKIAELKDLGFLTIRDGGFFVVPRFDYVVKRDGRFYSVKRDVFEKSFYKWSL